MRFEGLQKVALALSEERSLEVLFKRIAGELGHNREVALARLWMVGPAAQCEICRSRPNADKNRPSLHLRASVGGSLNGGEDWSRVDDDFHTGGVKVRQVFEQGEALLVKEVGERSARPMWIHREQIRSFAGHPLIFGGELLGVIGVFSRNPISETEFEWLRVFAIAMAGAIANARAFDEIHDLRRQLDSIPGINGVGGDPAPPGDVAIL